MRENYKKEMASLLARERTTDRILFSERLAGGVGRHSQGDYPKSHKSGSAGDSEEIHTVRTLANRVLRGIDGVTLR
jgi:hypothetical protein